MLRDVFYFGNKPNAHPREKPAKNLKDARSQATTDQFWIINEFCDYKNFEWDFDFDFLPDEEVWAEEHINVWPSVYQKDSGTWLVSNNDSEYIIYRNDVERLKRKNVKTDNWVLIDRVDESKFDFGWHPDPTDPPFIYRWGNKYYPVELMGAIEYRVPGATQVKYMNTVAELLPENERWEIPDNIDIDSFDFSWRPDPREPALIYEFGTQWRNNGGPRYICQGATQVKYVDGLKAKALPNQSDSNWKVLPGFNIEHFDYTWHPDNTAPAYIYVFGNQWYDSVTMPTVEYHVPGATERKYVTDCWATLGKNTENWVVPENIDTTDFDFSWIPNPYDPPMIYQFGTQWQKTGGPRYVVGNATEIKYMDNIKAVMLPNTDNWELSEIVDKDSFDYSWHPDDNDPAFIYVFGNQWYDAETMPTARYIVKGATDVKYVNDLKAKLLPKSDNWEVPSNIDVSTFDFSWIPNPYDKPYIYQFGTQWQKTGGPRYVVEGATEIKYIDATKATMLPDMSNWSVPEKVDVSNFDFSWHPDETAPPYIYQFGTQWGDQGGPRYIVDGATEIQYVSSVKARADIDFTKWQIPEGLNVDHFDFSWIPSTEDKPYIYQFGTQWQKTGGPRYVVEGATEVKYVDSQRAIKLSDPSKFIVLKDYILQSFDYSWHPDDSEPPYIYQFGNNQYSAEVMPTVEYVVEGASQVKYVNDNIARLGANKDKWTIPANIDDSMFDYSWVPHPDDPPYNYVFGTQWQKTGGPEYRVDGATTTKYVDSQKVIRLADKSNPAWHLVQDVEIEDFDYSWHPDASEPPYIYKFGNQHHSVESMPTLEYRVEDGDMAKYISDVKVTIKANKNNWIIPNDIDDSGFDYSWVPDPNDPPYVYVTGTQWQKTGGPKFISKGADLNSPIKYLEGKFVKKLPNVNNFKVVTDAPIKDFDYSWHPDETDPPYVYQFGNNLYDAEIMPTIEYVVDGAIHTKYINNNKATLAPNKSRWIVPEDIDDSGFDYSWVPNPKEPAYIYVSGTQHQKNGGPRYIVEGATEFKYIDGKVKKLPNKSKFTLIADVIVDSFDYTWHPDETDPPYIYVFGNNLYDAEIMPTIEYRTEGSIHTKYINDVKVTLGQNKKRWIVPKNIDDGGFDYSWVPNPKDPAYIYAAGTQWQKTGGPKYVVEGATEYKYLDIKVKRLPDRTNFRVIGDLRIKDFDYSWHPDETEPAYIYQFGNNLYDAEIMPTIEYSTEGAMHVKYINDIKATLGAMKYKWDIPKNIDDSGFDYSWVPNPKDPPYIYHSRTQHQKSGGPKFVVEGATSVKYIDQQVRRLPDKTNFTVIADISVEDFDYSWHPDETDPPYIYQFGNNLYDAEIMPTIQYMVGDPIHIKYVNDVKVKLAPMKHKWIIPDNIDDTGFDYSWVPNPKDPPYIYHSRTQHQKTGGPKFIVEGASQVKYIDQQVKKLADKTNFSLIADVLIDDFDYSWHPDETDPPFIYQFGNNLYSAEVMPTIEYKVGYPLHIKYVNEVRATLAPMKHKWIIPDNIDDTGFDYSWVPNPREPAYIYHSRTQHQKTGGPKFIVEGASQIKYIDQEVRRLPDKTNFSLIADVTISDFDYSWHPDETDPPFIYQFGNNLYSAEVMPTIEYKVGDPLHVKYVNEVRATLAPMKHKWTVPDNIDDTGFDYSWVPNPRDPAYIYISGTQHQKTGGPKFIVEGAKEVKYLEMQVKRLPDKTNFETVGDLIIEDFDYSWHPDETAPPYIYVFGNQHYMPETMPTIRYTVEGGLLEKFIHEPSATLGQDKRGWAIPKNIDVSEFDFSWKPNPYDPPYIYRFGTQWQKTGGPTYSVPGGTEFKYIEGSKARYLPNKNDSRWEIPEGIDISDFDFSWHSDSTERPYIYEFGTQWQKTGGPRYKVPGATQTKYINELKAKALPKGDNWDIPDGLDLDSFDFSWHPDSTEQPMIYQFGTQWQKTGGPRYIVPGAENSVDVVYIPTTKLKAIRLPNKKNWTVPANIDPTSIDYSWHPDDTEAPYIYHFGTQWNNRGGPTYTVPGATFYKYSNSIRGKLLPDKTNFVPLIPIEEDKFDYTWAPHPDDPPYIYVFGNQWHSAEIEPTVEYRVEGATEYKYVHDIKATVAPDKTNWRFLHKIDEDKFDFSWRPNPMDPPYIYRFGNQWHDAETMPTLEYVVGDAIHHKYVHEIIAPLAQNKDNWHVPGNIDAKQFDFSWVPHPHEAPKIYQFGTQWQRNGGPKYVMKDALDLAYVDIIKATRLGSKDNWTIPENVGDFDYSWHPDEDDPPYIYKFAMENDSDDNLTGPVYTVPGAEYVKIIKDIKGKIKVVEETIVETEIVTQTNEVEEFVEAQKYLITVSIDDLVYEHPNEVFWAIRENIDYTNFDFNWRPTVEQGKYRYVHVFGSAEYPQTQTYFVSGPMYRQGFTDVNYVESGKKVDEEYLATLFKPNDMFFVDRGNVEAKDRFERLKQKYPNIQKTRFLNSWVDTINRCINRSNTELCWILNSELDYSGFNFNYYPNQWQTRMVHVFGTQWSHWGTTFLVNRDTFAIDTKHIKIVEHLSNLNFVKDRKATATNNLYDIVLIDHGNNLETAKASLANKIGDKQITVVKYDKDYLTTMRNVVKQLPTKKEHYVWVCSSVCDYVDFDFTYITDPFARDNLHVFPSNNQKFGDTFMMDVNVTREVLNNITDLKDYPKIAYTNTIRSKRLSAPVVKVESDTHVGNLDVEFNFPYMVFCTENIEAKDDEPISLWDDSSKNILITSTGASRIIVPREAKDIVKNELYDYPYIKTSSRLSKSKPLDIVFLSNGELCADENYEHLLQVTKGTGNRIVRVDGIDGRVEAYHAALEASETPWAFTVFAKLKVNNKFDWTWQPDRLQIPKHYIFHSKNPLNGLEYGHQGMIAYNKKLTLNNSGKGLDFTLDDPHETVELLSGIATFNTDPYSTWRTAFREVIKLQSDYSDVAVERLNTWLNVAEGEYAEDCLRGAKDAVEYYDSVMGDIEALKKSYEWAWLKEFYRKKYK